MFGFLGTSNRYGAEAPATVKLKHCSHQLGVLPEWQSRGVGYALKVAQREAVLNQGVRLITWTYDPLESKNARLNIAKLGAVCNTYIRDYYGELRDDLNRGLATDRFQVDWWIASRRIETRLTRNRPPLQLRHYLDVGAPIINAVAVERSRSAGVRRPDRAAAIRSVFGGIPGGFSGDQTRRQRARHSVAAALAIDLRSGLCVRLHRDRLRARTRPARAQFLRDAADLNPAKAA